MKEGKKNLIKGSPRERRVAEVAARLFLFGVGVLWILLYLAAAVITYDQLFDPVLRLYFVGSDNVLSQAERLAVGALDGWYIITVVAAGIFFAFKVFRIIGKWEPRNRKDKEGQNDDVTN